MNAVNAITDAIIGDAIAIHREMGPGLLESTYEACLAALLARRGLNTERQAAMPVIFRGERLDCAYRLDLLVEGIVVVELKTVTKLEPVHFAQMMTYLKHSGCEVGLLINFNRRVWWMESVGSYEDMKNAPCPLFPRRSLRLILSRVAEPAIWRNESSESRRGG